jgi:hypothetical protein
VSERVAQAALQENRRLIIALSVLTGALGLIPVPLVGDLGIDLVRAALLRRLARRRKLELSRHAALIICGVQQVSVGRLAVSTALLVAMRYAWRRLTRTLLVLLRFDDMGRTFLLATIFDYYCLRHHWGGGAVRTLPHGGEEISLERAEAVRRALVATSSGVRDRVFSALFQRVFSDVVRAGTFVPRTLWTMAASALRDERAEVAERVVEEDLEGFFARITRAVERELSAAGQDVLASLCGGFDAAWTRETPAADADGGPQRIHSDGGERAGAVSGRSREETGEPASQTKTPGPGASE